MVLLGMGVLFACERRADSVVSAVVYNEDTQQQFFAVDLRTQQWAESVATMVPLTSISETAEGRRLSLGPTWGEKRNLCSDQAFRAEPTVGRCTGTLIGDDMILTAGHCTRLGCRGVGWAFGYRYQLEGELRVPQDDDLYTCVEVVTSGYSDGIDYSIVRLDRDVRNRTPIPLRTLPAELGGPVVLLSHPEGAPLKVDTNARVRAVDQTSLRVDVDAFAGSSGASVLDGNGAILGVLAQGMADYVARGDCNIVNSVACGAGCRIGEGAVTTEAIREHACAAQPSQLLFCTNEGGDGGVPVAGPSPQSSSCAVRARALRSANLIVANLTLANLALPMLALIWLTGRWFRRWKGKPS